MAALQPLQRRNPPSPTPTSEPRAHHRRLDIQGLRAVAVLAVIAAHAHVPGLAGGFVGVDVFFVISGYLICGLLQRELTRTGSIDLLSFWSRRVRRLLPNACLTLATTLLAVFLIEPGFIHPAMVAGIAAAAVWCANLYFAAISVDYFAADDVTSPVLHFWSLSVEEQFYIVWPLLLLALIRLSGARAASRTGWLLAAVALLSLALMLVTVQFNQPLAYFHTEMRAWQLAAGGLLAFHEHRLGTVPASLRGWLGWFGLGAIVGGIAVFNDTMLYPSWWALLPTLGAVALIAAPAPGHWPSPGWLLAAQPLQWLGDRSYALYLWHWPFLILGADALRGVAAPAGAQTALLLVLTLCTAAASYALIEAPMREGRWWPAAPRRSLLAATAGVAILVLACGLIAGPLAQGSGASAAVNAKLKRAAADRGRNIKARCNRVFDQTDQPLCAYGDPQATRTAVLFGDSHAAQWFEPLDKAARAQGWRLLAWTKSACPPAEVTIWRRANRAPFPACDEWRENILRRLIRDEKPELVFIAGFVASTTTVWDHQTGSVMDETQGQKAWRDGLVRVIERLRAADILPVVIADTPRADKWFRYCLAASGIQGCARPRAEALPQARPDVEAAEQAGVQLLDLTDQICAGESCPAVTAGMIVYRDRHHLTAGFAATLAAHFEPVLASSAVRQRPGPALRPSASPDAEPIAALDAGAGIAGLEDVRQEPASEALLQGD